MVVTLIVAMGIFVGYSINGIDHVADKASNEFTRIGDDLVSNISKIGINSVNNSKNTQSTINNLTDTSYNATLSLSKEVNLFNQNNSQNLNKILELLESQNFVIQKQNTLIATQNGLLNLVLDKIDNVSKIVLDALEDFKLSDNNNDNNQTNPTNTNNTTAPPPIIIIPDPPVINNTTPGGNNNTIPGGVDDNNNQTGTSEYFDTVCNYMPKAEVCINPIN